MQNVQMTSRNVSGLSVTVFVNILREKCLLLA